MPFLIIIAVFDGHANGIKIIKQKEVLLWSPHLRASLKRYVHGGFFRLPGSIKLLEVEHITAAGVNSKLPIPQSEHS